MNRIPFACSAIALAVVLGTHVANAQSVDAGTESAPPLPAPTPSAAPEATPALPPPAPPAPAAPKRARPAPAAPAAATPSAQDAPAPAANDETSEAPSGAATGFMMQARLSQSVGALSLSGGQTRTSLGASGAPVIAIGYRGERSAFGFGPSLSYFEFDTGPNKTSSLTLFGISAHFEVDLSQSEDRKNEIYFLGGLSVALASTSRTAASGDDGIDGQAAYGFFAGFGARHWATSHLGISVELAEGLTSFPIGTNATTVGGVSGASSTTNLRAAVVSTFGTIGVTIVP